LRSDGIVICWGYSFSGEIFAPNRTFTAVSAGRYHSCGVLADNGAITCWGESHTLPLGSFTALAASAVTNCAIKTDGTLACWASQGTMPAPPPSGAFKAIAGSLSRFCGIDANDEVQCFGESSDYPPGAETPPTAPAMSVGDGLDGSCAVLREQGASDGTLACWFNGYRKATPPQGSFRSVSVGYSGVCAVASDATLVCFAGDGSLDAVPPGQFKSVSVGLYYACAIAIDDRLVCWGTDAAGFGTTVIPS
jgi:hypothetical protein